MLEDISSRCCQDSEMVDYGIFTWSRLSFFVSLLPFFLSLALHFSNEKSSKLGVRSCSWHHWLILLSIFMNAPGKKLFLIESFSTRQQKRKLNLFFLLELGYREFVDQRFLLTSKLGIFIAYFFLAFELPKSLVRCISFTSPIPPIGAIFSSECGSGHVHVKRNSFQ